MTLLVRGGTTPLTPRRPTAGALVEVASGAHITQTWLGGRFRLDERISLDDQVSGPCGSFSDTAYALPSRDRMMR